MSLTLVLGNVGVDKVNNVCVCVFFFCFFFAICLNDTQRVVCKRTIADGGLEDGGEDDVADGGLVLLDGVDLNKRAGSLTHVI